MLGLPGCGLGAQTTPTAVAQARYFGSGDPDFDEYFLALYRIQELMQKAPQTLAGAHMALAQTLTLEADASTDALASQLQQRTRRLWARGVRVRAAVEQASTDPSGALAVVRASAPLTGDDQKLLQEVQRSATEVSRLSARLRVAERQLLELRERGAPLREQVSATFGSRGRARLAEVRRNLEDSGLEIARLLDRARAVDADAQEWLVLITRSADSARSGVASDAGAASRPAAEDKQRLGRVRSRTNLPDRPAKALPRATPPDAAGPEPATR